MVSEPQMTNVMANPSQSQSPVFVQHQNSRTTATSPRSPVLEQSQGTQEVAQAMV